jgi:hypothetical protein
MNEEAEGGFTLTEVLVALVITGFVVTAIASVLLLSFSSYPANAARLTLSNDAELLSSRLAPDVRSASDVNPSTTPGCFSGVSPSPPFLLTLTWSDAGSGYQYVAAYRAEGSELTRYYCDTNSNTVPLRDVVGRDLDPARSPTVNITNQQLAVTVTTLLSNTSYTYTVSASRRTNASFFISWAMVGTSSVPPCPCVTVKGYAARGSTVTVTATDGTADQPGYGQTTADKSTGAWSVTFSVASLHTGTIVITAQSGNSTSAITATATTKNFVPVVITSGPPEYVNAASTSVTLSGTAESGASVTLTASDGNRVVPFSPTPVTAGANGIWTNRIDVRRLRDGPIAFTAMATDADGNTTTATKSATKDTVAPVPIVTIVSKSPTGASPLTFGVAFAEPVANVDATKWNVSAPPADTGLTKSIQQTDPQHFTVKVMGMKQDGTGDGVIGLTLTAGAVKDVAGNPSVASNTGAITWKSPPQGLTIQETAGPQHEAIFSGIAGYAPGDNATVSVTVCSTNVFPCTAAEATLSSSVDPSTGMWQVTSAPLGKNETHYAQVVQSDNAGNISRATTSQFTT